MTTVAIVQARMGSTRLPGKVLADLGGRPMLARVLERLGRSRTLDLVVVATTTEPADDTVARLCEELRVPVYRGSEDDVLERYAEAARRFGADVVVRITADCPLLDPEVVDRVVEHFHTEGADYASNTLERTFPQGLDVEVFRAEALALAAREAREPWERAHVTPFLYRHPDRFALASLTQDRVAARHRWTVDTAEDLELARKLYARLGDSDGGWLEALNLVERDPSLAAINAGVEQKRLEEG